MKYDIQRLRNLTTGILHTEIGHIYEDIESITGAKGVMANSKIARPKDAAKMLSRLYEGIRLQLSRLPG